MAFLAIVTLGLFALRVQTLVLPDLEQVFLSLVGDDVKETGQQNDNCDKKIAIIGSGITGAIASFKLYEGYKRQSLPSERPCITVFERNPIVGGRITEAYIYNDPARPIGTCAATFGLNDACIANAVTEVGLVPQQEEIVRPRAGTGVWDGGKIVGLVDEGGFRNPPVWSYYKTLEWRSRYGRFPEQFDLNVSSVRLNFDQLLPVQLGAAVPSEPVPGRRNLSEEVHTLGLGKLVQSPSCLDEPFDFVESEEGRLFVKEAVLPGIRERFFTNGLDYNMLELYLGFEDELPTFVEGGNLRLIERLLRLSGASIRVGTEVREVEKMNPGELARLTSVPVAGGSTVTEEYDAVVIATSLERGNITFKPSLSSVSGLEQDYEDSVVTHFTSARRLNPSFFNFSSTMPQNVLTTENCTDDSCDRPLFFSLTFLKEVLSPETEFQESRTEHLYKIVSRDEISDTTIEDYLMPQDNGPDDPFTPAVSWIHREILPKSVPIATPDRGEKCRTLLEDIELITGVYYAGGGEQVIAPAEFACRMGQNAANLIVKGSMK